MIRDLASATTGQVATALSIRSGLPALAPSTPPMAVAIGGTMFLVVVVAIGLVAGPIGPLVAVPSILGGTASLEWAIRRYRLDVVDVLLAIMAIVMVLVIGMTVAS